ncbi:hypothetical protein B0G73_112191 [Paraburkholderia sp. BL25I1N1]|nr:hypothetical protein B0G73_112191 [Paraburkholderia sp. BL25I1N1]
MEFGPDSFAAVSPDPVSAKLLSATDQMANLL